MHFLHSLTSPAKLSRIIQMLLPWLVAGAVLLFGVGVYIALFASPADYQQGEAVRIMYVHVPAAWMGLMVYGLMAVCSFSHLVWKNPATGMVAVAAAPLGAGFTLLCLISGMAWGKPIWGTWWVWDARLTSVLILWFFYLGYIALYHAIEDKEHAMKVCAILNLVGAINLPIVKFSVEWWHTLHQPASILRSGGMAIDPSMLLPLFTTAAAYFCLFGALLGMRVQTLFAERKLQRLR